MAVTLAATEVSDLCIGKPPLRSIPASATVSDALAALRRWEAPFLNVWSTTTTPPACLGKVGFVDALCFICSDDHVSDPSRALASPVSALLDPGAAALVRPIDLHCSVLDALDLILDGAQNLLVPIRGSARKKAATAIPHDGPDYCCLSQEDFVRFFLNSIGLFSPVPALSVDALGLICPHVLAVGYHDPAVSAVPLIRLAASSQTAVAVVSPDGALVGEISPSAVALCGGGDEAVAAALAALSAGELMAYVDCGGTPPEHVTRTVKERLRERGMKGMLELMEDVEDAAADGISLFSSSASSSSLSSSSSSSDDESVVVAAENSNNNKKKKRRGGSGSGSGSGSGRRYKRSGSYSARMGRRTEEAIVCHPGSSLVAVMMQALAHRVGYVWVVEEDYELAGVVAFPDILRVFRELLS